MHNAGTPRGWLTLPASCRGVEQACLGKFCCSGVSETTADTVIKASCTSTRSRLQYSPKDLDVVDAHAATAANDLHTLS